jgi:16S rRNA (adenine1518-N6/adenine1519-N6)-dimethyltransferase
VLTPQQYFRLHGSKPRKRFGQHFLAQAATADRIAQCAQLDGADVVVEVGPGLGALTQFIIAQVECLHLVELDRDLAAYLEASLPAAECQLHVHQQDILTFDFMALRRSVGRRLVILGNLPYNISSPLIFHLLEAASAIKRAVFMVQKEVGERLVATPGRKNYGVLSVLLPAYAQVTPLFSVGPSQFYPPPRVESLVLRVEFRDAPLVDTETYARLRRVVNVTFQQRRKTLRNGLRSLWQGDPAELAAVLQRAGIDPQRRPETLTLDEFLLLTQSLALCEANFEGT